MVCLLLRRSVLHGHGRECKHSQAYCSIYRHLKPDVCAHRYIVEWCGMSINRPPGDHSCVTTQLPSTLRLFCSKFYKMCKSRSLQIQRAVMCQQWPSCLPVVGARASCVRKQPRSPPGQPISNVHIHQNHAFDKARVLVICSCLAARIGLRVPASAVAKAPTRDPRRRVASWRQVP